MIDSPTRRRVLMGAGTAAWALATGSARAQALPAGPLKLLVGYAPGGGTDVIARIIADKLRERVGANVLIENRPGASGMMAAVALKSAPADGSVIMLAPSVSTVQQKVTRKTMPFDLERDLAPITLAGTVATVYVVSATTGVTSLAEYVQWLKKNPQKSNFGTAAMGSTTHFFGVEIGQAVGIPLDAVAYKGTGPLMTDLIAGHIPAGCGGLTSFLQHHQAGKVRILAISTARRAGAAPELPTIGELGYPALTSEGFYGFYAPARTGAAQIDAWNRVLRSALEQPDLRQRLEGLGLDVQTSTPAELIAYQAKSIVSFTASMKAAGFEPE